MKKLYDIQDEYLALTDELEELMQGEPTQEQMDSLNKRLEINAQEFEQKAEAYAAVIAQKRAEAKFLKDEAKKLVERAKAAESLADRLIDRIAWAMNAQAVEKVELPHFKLRFQKSISVNIVDMAQLPSVYVRTKIETEPDKQSIKQAIQSGMPVPGAELKENRSLVVK